MDRLSEIPSRGPSSSEPAFGLPPGLLRPPGALGEAAFLDACTRCGDCLKACPPLALRRAEPALGRRLEGTPVLAPGESPCLLCPDWPCIAACPAGALLPPGPGLLPKLGRAVVNEDRCLAARGQPCDACRAACPVEPNAVGLEGPGAPARIDASVCTGCGQCLPACPAGALRVESSS